MNISIHIAEIKRKVSTALLAAAMGVFLVLACGFKPVYVSVEDNLALSGYDTVAYFVEGRGVRGSAIYSVEWHGAVWRFSSKTNMRLFQENPEKYAPQFGGYCAVALAYEKVAGCDPESFLIVDGKLYVMLDQEVLKTWKQNPKSYIGKAEKYWSHLMNDWEKTGKK